MMAFFTSVAARAGADWPYRLAAGGFFGLVALVYYLPALGWLPRGIHEWAQADRLALAISFYDHGLHLFRPQTLSLSSVDGVVGVELPLLPYLAALGAKLAGRATLVPLYRLLTIGMAWLAQYYLFRLVFERSRQFAAALLPGLFLAVSPVFAYYAGNFLPDPASAALVLVATYYLLRFRPGQPFGPLMVAILLFTLATLIKLSAGIYLLAGLGTVLLWGYLQPAAFALRQRLLLLLLTGASLGAVLGYTLYNQYLNEAYHSSLFLARPLPIESAEQYQRIVRHIEELWVGEYFVPFQYRLLLASALICLLSLPRLVRTEWVWVAQLGLATIGALAFFRLMGVQFFDHDYYVLASFWPGLVLLVALATTQLALRLAAAPGLLRSALFGVALVALLATGLPRYRARTGNVYPPFSDYYSYRWMQGGAAQLAAAQVPATATVLVLGEEAPNLSLVYFDRRGLVWNASDEEEEPSNVLQKMTDVGLDYLVLQRSTLQGIVRRYPAFLAPFRTTVSNPRYVVLQRLNAPKHW
jgi:hypothetical protein